MGDVSLNELIVPAHLSDPPAQGRYGRLLGPLGARRRESRSLHDRPRRGSGVLDGRPRSRLSRSSSPPAWSRTRCRTSTTTRGGRRSPAWWTSASRSIRRSTPTAPTSPKGPAATHGSRLRAELAKRNQRLPLLGDDDVTADRNYIKEFSLMARSRELGKQYGVEYAEAFHYIPAGAPARTAIPASTLTSRSTSSRRSRRRAFRRPPVAAGHCRENALRPRLHAVTPLHCSLTMAAAESGNVAVLAEKPSVARDIARVLGAGTKGDGYLHGNGYVVTWAIGHLAALAQPHEINPEWRQWRRNLLPMLPAAVAAGGLREDQGPVRDGQADPDFAARSRAWCAPPTPGARAS